MIKLEPLLGDHVVDIRARLVHFWAIGISSSRIPDARERF